MSVELGVVLVGARAAALADRLPALLPRVRVAHDVVLPLREDLKAMAALAADATFYGADVDRWRWMSEDELDTGADVLWASALVQSANLPAACAAWDKVLVVGWSDEPGLVAAIRAVVERERPVTVLLGGEGAATDAVREQGVRVALADLVRRNQLTTVLCNPNPQDVLDVAIDAARAPEPLKVPRARPVDVGPALDLPSTWVMPAPPVHFFRLVHVPMGHAARLGAVARRVIAYKALGDLLMGPPVEVEAPRRPSARELRAQLPESALPERLQQRIIETLGRIRFEGPRPLADAIDGALRPLAAEVHGVLSIVESIERLRLQHLRGFTAAGVHYTAQALAARAEGTEDPFPPERISQVRELLAGDASGPLGWRRAFAGLSCQIAQPGTAGWTVARQIARERFDLFRGDFAAEVGRRLAALLRRAADVDAAPSLAELNQLHDRAERVRADLERLERAARRRIDADCVLAVAEDRLVRWAAPEGPDLLRLLSARVEELPAYAQVQRRIHGLLTRRSLGSADDTDFERYVQELQREGQALLDGEDDAPAYEDVLLLLLQGRDPPVLRQALAASQGTEVELHLERPVEPALMNWLTATGMLVVVAPRLKTCAIYWQRLEALTDPDAQRRRAPSTEHRLADLLLARPEGESVEDLAQLATAVVYVQVGIVVGTLKLRRRENSQVVEVLAPRLAPSRRWLLPYDAIHAFAADPELLGRLRAQVHDAIAALSLRADAVDMVRKLAEIAHMGLAPSVAAQLGVHGPRVQNLEHPMQAMLRRCSALALTTLTDCLHTAELAASARTPRRRVLTDVLHLGPT